MKKAEFEAASKAYYDVYYNILRNNAIVTRKASRTIEAITRGDDTFRFACQALASSIFDITNAELTEVATKANLPPLGENDDIEAPAEAAPVEAPVAVETSVAVDAPAAETPAVDAPAAETPAVESAGGLTKERAEELARIAEAQMEDKNNKLDAAMAEEKYEECDVLSGESEKLETYTSELKKFAKGETSEEPVAPECFDANFAVKASSGEDLFLGM